MALKKTLHAEYPAFAIYRHSMVPPASNYDYVINHGDLLFRIDLPVSGTYMPGSAASYALEYNDCPIAAYSDCVAKGHETHWINACASVISSSPAAQKDVIGVKPGDRVLFEGRIFEIIATPNRNLGLNFIDMA